MKTCKGCGVILQDSDVNATGYVRSLEQDYCQRCFRLTHYGDTSKLKNHLVNNENTFSIYRKYKDEVFVLIIDVMDLFCIDKDDLLNTFSDYRTMLIINKMDLLPENISQYRINRLLDDMLREFSKKYPKLLSALITHKKDPHFNDLFYELLDDLKIDTLVFAGRSNAGKSTLINKILNESVLTTSVYPSTTLADNQIKHDRYTFIDTPGLIDPDNCSSYLDDLEFRKVMITRTIKPKVFQFDSRQSYFYEGLLRVDVDPKESGSITFYISSDIDIHRCRYEKADDYFKNHFDEFKVRSKAPVGRHYCVKGYQLFVIKGLGLVKINGDVDVDIHIHEDIMIYLSQEKI